jgi:hypothetical protein
MTAMKPTMFAVFLYEEARLAVELTLGDIRGFFFWSAIAQGLQFRFLFATMEQEFGDSSSS